MSYVSSTVPVVRIVRVCCALGSAVHGHILQGPLMSEVSVVMEHVTHTLRIYNSDVC